MKVELQVRAADALKRMCLEQLDCKALTQSQRHGIAAALGAIWILEPWKAVPLLEAFAQVMGIKQSRIDEAINFGVSPTIDATFEAEGPQRG